MAEADFQRLELYNQVLIRCHADPSCNRSLLTFHNTSLAYDLNFAGDGSPLLRTVVSIMYCAVAAAGVLGNLLVLHLLCSTRTVVKSTINVFVFHLAVADFLLSLALPFWAVDIALDYVWPFGLAMCKFVTLLTGVNVYATIFFMTAMSFARFCLVATALKPAAPLGCKLRASQVTATLIWVGAMLFATPRAVFAELQSVGDSNDTTCLYRFPEGTSWLGANHILRILFGFLLPYLVIMLSYLLLLRFLCRQRLNGVNRRRQANVSKSVAVVVLSFVICWFPYNLLSIWHTLVLLDLTDISRYYYFAQTYLFPLANCLAFTNTCLNPIIYCFIRREYRKALHNLVFKSCLSSVSKACLSAVNSNEGQSHNGQLAIPLNNMESQTALSYTKRSALPSTTLSPVPSPKSICPLNDLT
ncbi:relaxin-3 receptor 1 [Esox lucius]|uniref:G-protein coupled receptors family 1 profile domain-containing protein n=1 Tax=Esox lucius TaxID=8010 RepID=A0AAY5JX45_ESOLU|nr:relaxin-3 receptor 1 [Esox lucius]XP_010872087.1 relaxin-3 receptor 1 [Esox lucius]XP_010872089.1 relaxin-3 receptor 1 [Esox lucius]